MSNDNNFDSKQPMSMSGWGLLKLFAWILAAYFIVPLLSERSNFAILNFISSENIKGTMNVESLKSIKNKYLQ